MTTLRELADPDCKNCYGSGYVSGGVTGPPDIRFNCVSLCFCLYRDRDSGGTAEPVREWEVEGIPINGGYKFIYPAPVAVTAGEMIEEEVVIESGKATLTGRVRGKSIT